MIKAPYIAGRWVHPRGEHLGQRAFPLRATGETVRDAQSEDTASLCGTTVFFRYSVLVPKVEVDLEVDPLG